MMKLLKCSLLAGALFFASYALANPSIDELKVKANSGDVEAQVDLADVYVEQQNFKEAFTWYSKAAEQNNAYAQLNLALMYSEGAGVEANEQKYVEYLEKSANNNNSDAQFQLGVLYLQGEIVKADDKKGFNLVKQAAEQNNAGANYMLGALYASGKGVKANLKLAKKYFNNACILGDKDACQDVKKLP